MIGIENREQRDCESLIMVNTSQYFWLANSSISTRQMIHSRLINHFIEDYYCHQSCFFFHLHLTVTDVIIIYTGAVWGIFLSDREVRGQGERRSSPGSLSIFPKDTSVLQHRRFQTPGLSIQRSDHKPTLHSVTTVTPPERSPPVCSHMLYHIPSWASLGMWTSSNFEKVLKTCQFSLQHVVELL